MWFSWLSIVLQSERLPFDSQSGHMPGLQVRFPVEVGSRGN